MTAHVARDPFARSCLHREPSDRPCQWCGSPPPTFAYTYESDAGPCPPRTIGGYRPRAFCNLNCLDAYHGRP
jgi:hypothetical protein